MICDSVSDLSVCHAEESKHLLVDSWAEQGVIHLTFEAGDRLA